MNSSAIRICNPAFLDRSPIFDALRPAASRVGVHGWPDIGVLNAALSTAGVTTGGGHPACLVAPSLDHVGVGEAYEACAFRTGAIRHRERDWHDLFNALVWLSFPLSKAALNARHVGELAREAPGQRGRVRDALTLFDEDGLIIASSKPDLLGLIREFRWKELFWCRRSDVATHMRFVVFGHALYHKALAPFLGMTGRAVLMAADADFFGLRLADQLVALDTRLAAILKAPKLVCNPRDLSPVPVLGLPGWLNEMQDERFYDNTDYFRPGRTHAAEPK